MNSSDAGYFFSRLMVIAAECRFTVVRLGMVFGYPLILLVPPVLKRPRKLVAAGFHGEEQAGPWGILHFLETMSAATYMTNCISYMPLVNPTGFSRNRRFNDDGQSPNTGFIPQDDSEVLSKEGVFLLNAASILANLALDGFLSLHEQTHEHAFYTYALERDDEPSVAALYMRDMGADYFPVATDGPIPPPGGGEVVDGIVMNHHDGTFEDLLFSMGTPRCYTTETPVDDCFAKRVEANAALIRQFIDI